MEWIVSLEADADGVELRQRLAELEAALVRAGIGASVDEGEYGLGTTVIVRCDDMEEALHRGLAMLRQAEREAGLPELPFVTAEVIAASG